MAWYDARVVRGTEDSRAQSPWLSFLLAYAAMAPLVAAAIGVLAIHGAVAAMLVHLGVMWAGGLLCFFAGVDRGLSFRQPGGPRVLQLGSMLWLFGTGVVSLMSPWPAPALVLCLTGFASMAVLDPVAARLGEAPRYFARLRPAQLLWPVASLAVLLWEAVRGG